MRCRSRSPTTTAGILSSRCLQGGAAIDGDTESRQTTTTKQRSGCISKWLKYSPQRLHFHALTMPPFYLELIGSRELSRLETQRAQKAGPPFLTPGHGLCFGCISHFIPETRITFESFFCIVCCLCAGLAASQPCKTIPNHSMCILLAPTVHPV